MPVVFCVTRDTTLIGHDPLEITPECYKALGGIVVF